MRTFTDIGGKVKTLLSSPDPAEDAWGVLNPSISYSPKTGYAMLVRSANYRVGREDFATTVYGSHYILNRNYLADLTDDLELTNLRLIEEQHANSNLHRGMEDGRLVWNTENSTWTIVCTLYEPPYYPDATIGIYDLDPKTMRAQFREALVSPVGGSEKNWMAPSAPAEFDYVYDAFQTITDGKLHTVLDREFHPQLRSMHGGTQLLAQEDGGYLAVVHDLTNESVYSDYYERMKNFRLAGTTRRVYSHYFARYDEHGKMVGISDGFMFDHIGIEFAAGMVEKDGDLLISYGENDDTVRLAVISKARALELINPL